jgi:hypothetical protein
MHLDFMMRDTGYGTRDTGTNSKIGFIFTGTLTPGPGIIDVFLSFLYFHKLLGISLQGKNRRARGWGRGPSCCRSVRTPKPQVYLRAWGGEKLPRSFVFIDITGCTFIFENRSQESGFRSQDSGTGT